MATKRAVWQELLKDYNFIVHKRFSGGKIDYEQIQKRENQAKKLYDASRSRYDNIEKISKNTGWKSEVIKEIKIHTFIAEHDIYGATKRFDQDYQIAKAWEHLISVDSLERDILLLKHEYLELTYMRRYGWDYETAHKRASENHDWNAALERDGEV